MVVGDTVEGSFQVNLCKQHSMGIRVVNMPMYEVEKIQNIKHSRGMSQAPIVIWIKKRRYYRKEPISEATFIYLG